jgi:hypothetical protein
MPQAGILDTSVVIDLLAHPRRRLADLMIASVAAANRLPLLTRNPTDFVGLESMVTVIAV